MPTQTFLNLSNEKKNKIIQAAIKEFSIRNLVEGNISNIVKDANISRGSFYQYFTSKEDIYIHIFNELRNERAEYAKDTEALYKKASFLEYFKAFYLKDAEFLLLHPEHISLGKHLYTCPSEVARALILQQQNKYKNKFLIAVEYDKGRGLIAEEVDSPVFVDFLVHMCTDIFIFQNMTSRLSIANLEDDIDKLLYILENGILPTTIKKG